MTQMLGLIGVAFEAEAASPEKMGVYPEKFGKGGSFEQCGCD
ncbi:hypothetical protein [Nitratidesulfovibrio vulgaris]|nr:hypothetical protein [Nitratidesulfovibrio vulgaris]